MAKTTKPGNDTAHTTLREGHKAPAFTVVDDQGRNVTLSDFKGRKLVLFFYPKDNTSGCTKEACSFRDALTAIRKKGAEVVGVSPDPVKSHQKFKTDHNLPFTLLSDGDKSMVEAFGVWKEKSLYGRKYMGVERTTVVIDETGKVLKVFPKVKIDGHVDEVLACL